MRRREGGPGRPPRPVALEDAGYGVPLADVDAVGAGVVEKDAVEEGAGDLVGVRVGAAGLAEVPGPGGFFAAPDHGCAVLGEESGVSDAVVGAELFEDGDAGREQRFADVVAGESLALEGTTRKPLRASMAAAVAPPGPPPMTATSVMVVPVVPALSNYPDLMRRVLSTLTLTLSQSWGGNWRHDCEQLPS